MKKHNAGQVYVALPEIEECGNGRLEIEKKILELSKNLGSVSGLKAYNASL
jgi:hypothetical protein